jgi:MFS family permease
MSDPPVRRNTVLLAAALAANSAMLQLSAAVATLTVVLVVGVRSLVGLGPAIVLGTGALSALPAGRAMDRFGRVPVLVTGFALGIAGGLLAAAGSAFDLSVAVFVGLAFVGAASATALLARTAAGDMYPPSRRARGISFVLFGAVFGAILGPTVFSPLIAGRDLDADALVFPWLAASAFMVLGLVLVASVRPDPSKIARKLAGPDDREKPAPQAAELSVILTRPGVLPSMVAAMASFSTMVGIMTLTGVVVVDRGHPADVVFPIIGAHVVGMYALVIVVGDLIDRIGRTRSLVGGLALMAASAVSLIWFADVATIALALFALGLLVRRGDGAARRLHGACGTRKASRPHRPALGPHRSRARLDRRLRPRCGRRRGARSRRHGHRARPGRLGRALFAADAHSRARAVRGRLTAGTIRPRRTPGPPFSV